MLEAYKRGWGLFTRDDGSLSIQKLDDPDGVAEDYGYKFCGRRFISDDHARQHVEGMAKSGDKLSQKACKLVVTPPLETKYICDGALHTREVTAHLISASAWFVVTPLPNDKYEIEVKPDMAATLARITEPAWDTSLFK